jgi:hypothetical protein
VVRPIFADSAGIQHIGSQIIVTANDSMPLSQAISALRLEYGWKIDLESAPCYSHFDLVDDTGPKWRAAHPNEKGVTRPAGGLFTANLPEPSDASDIAGEYLALSMLTRQYNATSNPGRYVLRAGPNGQLTIVGTGVRDEAGAPQEVSPLLDTRITLTMAPRTVYDTIEAIRNALQSTTGKKILDGDFSSSLFRTARATVGGEGIAARDLLDDALASTGKTMQYDLFFNADANAYILNTLPVMRLQGGDRPGGTPLAVTEP